MNTKFVSACVCLCVYVCLTLDSVAVLARMSLFMQSGQAQWRTPRGLGLGDSSCPAIVCRAALQLLLNSEVVRHHGAQPKWSSWGFATLQYEFGYGGYGICFCVWRGYIYTCVCVMHG
jgi:hypothetical protein